MDETLTSRIADSVLPYPEGLTRKIKYFLWKYIISDGFEWGRDFLLKTGFIRHGVSRQEFVIGKLAPDVKVADFVKYLEGQQFGNHFVAWIDDEQIISVRRLDGFEKQYHLRVFKDREVRGHYEWTPECHPKWHLQEYQMEDRRDDFMRFVGDWVVPIK
ncbi:MAG TPA: hypothetical protein VMT99_01980 [Candidatus Paceibacterota bacterium]|nr:hypothetical protein [Candidatus Paceibacterota bacterium]